MRGVVHFVIETLSIHLRVRQINVVSLRTIVRQLRVRLLPVRTAERRPDFAGVEELRLCPRALRRRRGRYQKVGIAPNGADADSDVGREVRTV